MPISLFRITCVSEMPQGTMYSPEIQVFDRKLGLNDACGFHSRSQHILLIRKVVRVCNPVQLVQVAREKFALMMLHFPQPRPREVKHFARSHTSNVIETELESISLNLGFFPSNCYMSFQKER